MSATSQWAGAHEVTVTLSTAQPCTDGTLSIDVSTFDATNILGPTSTGGLLFEETGVDTVAVKLSFSVVIDKLAIKTYTPGALVTGVSYAGPDGQTYSGSARITKVTKPIAAKGGFKVGVESMFTGAVTGI